MERFSFGLGNLTNLISLGLDIYEGGYPLNWNSYCFIRIARLPKLNTFRTFEEASKSKKALLFKINRNLVNIKRCW